VVAQLFWGVDGRTHRLGPDGMALCRVQIDNSRPPEDRAVSGCPVCDILLRDRDIWGTRPRPGVNPAFPLLLAGITVVVLIWTLTRLF
jgi:hypothetical protein